MPKTYCLNQFGAHQKALQLFDEVVTDPVPLTREHSLQRLVGQQYASADSIASNIAVGYGRGTKREYCHFLTIPRGYAPETRGRYGRLRHWLPAEVVAMRISLCDEIIAILAATITRLRPQISEQPRLRSL